MSKIAVVYWSGTGNTEAMAEAIAEAANAEIYEVSAFSVDMADKYDKIALGCPAMGDEVLEEEEFEPFFSELLGRLNGKKIALFGSYGWGDGRWMREWEDRVRDAGALLFDEGLIINSTPDNDGIDECESYGKAFADC